MSKTISMNGATFGCSFVVDGETLATTLNYRREKYMGKVLAYGEITITDLTDGKQIQAYVTSNQPNFVSY